MFGCTICHRTGVVMQPGCDCGASWASTHEAWCSTVPCPEDCPVAATKDDALRVWAARWRKEATRA